MPPERASVDPSGEGAFIEPFRGRRRDGADNPPRKTEATEAQLPVYSQFSACLR
jgi:hypothetical protein